MSLPRRGRCGCSPQLRENRARPPSAGHLAVGSKRGRDCRKGTCQCGATLGTLESPPAHLVPVRGHNPSTAATDGSGVTVRQGPPSSRVPSSSATPSNGRDKARQTPHKNGRTHSCHFTTSAEGILAGTIFENAFCSQNKYQIGEGMVPKNSNQSKSVEMEPGFKRLCGLSENRSHRRNPKNVRMCSEERFMRRSAWVR